MLDKDMLEAIGQIMDKKLDAKLEPIQQDISRLKVIFENDIAKQINLLIEGQADILGKLIPRSRIDEMEDELKFLKTIVRQMNEDLQMLKKAQ
jgi:archaellum component FlaC